MKFLEECGFLEEDIKEYEGNTPELVRKTIDEIIFSTIMIGEKFE